MRTLALIFVAILLCSAAAFADGMIFPVERPHSTRFVPNELFTVKYHHVNVTINDQLANTKVDQVFHNDSSIDREGIYVFPMPEGSAISKFSMFAGENEIAGKMLDKSEARSIYESIVRQRRDPAILEYIDRNTFRASVYPIPAHGDKRIRLDYSEIVPKSGNAYRYVYSLSTERFSARPLESCKVTIKLHCKRPITNIYSPTHQIHVDRTSDNEATVTWKVENAKPDTDLVLYYSMSDDEVGIDLVPYREKGHKGFYLLLASPRVEADKSKVQPKNVVFVFDRTGSMAGDKIDQTKEAIKFCINSLHKDDQFNVISFNESADPLFSELEKPTAERKRKALDAVDALDATGSTDINKAISAALRQFKDYGSQRNYIIFLTDGLPTSGETDPVAILKNAKASDKNNVRIFAFGVGYDVNTHLLDQISQTSKGDTDYVRPRENIEARVSTFFAKVSEPLLFDVKLTIIGGETSDAYPSKDLPDIFRGSQLIVLGRYSASGKVKVELSGLANGKRKTFTLNSTLPESEDSSPFVPQLWAARKIGYLLDEIRLHSNQELIDEVVRLSKEYGIPTEYTSFLADDRNLTANLDFSYKRARKEAGAAVQQTGGKWGVAQSSNANAARNNAQVAASAAPPGAFDSSGGAGNTQVLGSMAPNSRVGGTYYDDKDQLVVVANVQNVAQRTFYQRGIYWEDGNVKPNQQFTKIKQFSDAHFELLRRYPKLSQFSTLGNIRLLLENNQGIEIGPEGKDKLTDKEINDLLKGV
jgi:uncharacterized protein YegL